jgi:predicted PurR-regulated permease PerM
MRERGALIFLSSLLAVLAAFCVLIARPLIEPGLFACLLAVAFFPFHEWLRKRIRWPSIAALLSTLLIFVIILLPLTFIGVTVGREVSDQYSKLKTASKEDGGVAPYLQHKMEAAIRVVAPRLQMEEPELNAEITTRLEAGLNWIARRLATGVLAFAGLIVNAVFAAVILFFFLRDGDKIRAAMIDLMPLKRADSEQMMVVIRDTIQANLHGVIGVAAAQGGLLTIGLMIAGIPSPFTWGVIGAFGAMVPMVGPTIVWVPATIWLVAKGSYGTAIFLAAWGLVVGIVDNIVRPLVVGGQTNQHPMLVFISILGGVSLFGVMGLFLGPLLISVTIAVFAVFRREVAAEANS